jgi:hypothetical protein
LPSSEGLGFRVWKEEGNVRRRRSGRRRDQRERGKGKCTANDEGDLETLGALCHESFVAGIPRLNRAPWDDLPILLTDLSLVVNQDELRGIDDVKSDIEGGATPQRTRR